MNRTTVAVLLLLASISASAELKIDLSEERIARGKYLVHQTTGCDGCHSERERGFYSFPPKQRLLLAGGNIFIDIGPRAVSPNITPYGLGSWSDQEVFDAITAGVRPDGRVLDPVMPYQVYGRMEAEQIYDMIAYLRSIEPIPAGPYPAEFPGEHTAFQPRFGELARPDDNAPEAELGAYLVEVARCNACHQGVGHDAINNQPYAGGREFRAPGLGLMRAANLTPDPTTGIGAWSREIFLARFKAMRGSWQTRVEAGSANTVMHWWQYSDMTETDLSAIFAYLRTLEPTTNSVVRFEPLPGQIVNRRSWSEMQAASTSAQ
jgi:hypothetical protein